MLAKCNDKNLNSMKPPLCEGGATIAFKVVFSFVFRVPDKGEKRDRYDQREESEKKRQQGLREGFRYETRKSSRGDG